MDCSFCYLSKEERSNKHRVNLDVLDNTLDCIRKRWEIDHVDVYGGEIALLGADYLSELFTLLKQSIGYRAKINVITNLLKTNPAIMENYNLDISVSYDFKSREKSDIVLNNIINSNRDVSILMLGTKEVLSMSPNTIINTFNIIKNAISLEIKPYSTNQCNTHDILDANFESLIKSISSSEKEKRFVFVNETWAKDCLDGKYTAYSDNHLYITPDSGYAVLDFDENDNEYFKKLESLDDYEEWTEAEKNKVQSLPHCSNCQYLGGCMTEHYKTACSGYPNLLDWFKERL